MARRQMRVIDSGAIVGAVEFDGSRLVLEGLAAEIFARPRRAVGDIKLGRELIQNGWMNMAVELGPIILPGGAGRVV